MSEQLSYFTTVVFADIAGSSKLYKKIGNDEANRRIGDVVEKLVRATEAFHGVVVKTIGDEVMCHFPDANDACTATIIFQDITEKMLPIRVGMAYGTVIEKDGDIFGQAVNDAAAVSKIARGSQIITTEEYRGLLNAENFSKLSSFDEVKLKGGQDSTKLYRIDWQSADSGDDHTVIMTNSNVTRGELVLSYKDSTGKTESVTLTPENVPFHIGRGADVCQLSLPTTLASRDHCHIDYQYGKFILKDHSTNGTYVQTVAGGRIYLRREDMPLQGWGEISLGQKFSDTNKFIIKFVS